MLGRFPYDDALLLLTQFLRDLARTEEGRKSLAEYGLRVLSTHDGPPEAGDQVTLEEAQQVFSRSVHQAETGHVLATTPQAPDVPGEPNVH